jgi:alanine racemase
VKADGYGYGAAEMGAVFLRNGADYLAVADLSEGVRLRQRGIGAPVLVYPNSLPEAAGDTLAHGLIPTLVDLEAAHAYSQAATVRATSSSRSTWGSSARRARFEAVKTIRAR